MLMALVDTGERHMTATLLITNYDYTAQYFLVSSLGANGCEI